ncbi:unnamed protein product [Spirodela intermedia]|uniref:Protein kinase domain-containing protein n=1 Tax=Spirodela intermedia TaxID=51605 RepID=A0A7I8KRV1_SPIIN|nr:unnamed protein product [Spirodela intermedia]
MASPHRSGTPLISPPFFYAPFLASRLLLVLLFSPLATVPAAATSNDTDALTAFRLSTDAHGILASNWSSPDACSGRWRGVTCSPGLGRVISLSLPAFDLRGPLDPLALLDQLRILDLRGNRLNGSLAPAFLLPNLRLLYLSRNDFSGNIPAAGLARLPRLIRLDLSDNSLTGPIPSAVALAHIPGLRTLRLQDNLLIGGIPDVAAAIPSLKDFNVSNNQLSGKVPDAVQAKFGNVSFAGNAGLCGSRAPLLLCSSTGRVGGTMSPPPPSVPPIVPSTLTSEFGSLSAGSGGNTSGTEPGKRGGDGWAQKMCPLAIVGIANNGEKGDGGMIHRDSNNTYNPDAAAEVHGSSSLVFFDKRRGFELEDLLRASAEMLGKGSLGTVYRAVLESGYAVAVKRLKDANPCSRIEFERYMKVVGGLRHPNLVRLRAYYYAAQEKLLVYDYQPNGSLFSLLHGNRGRPQRVPLDWTARIALVMGASRGLAFIHEQYSSARIPHGNLKSSNILLDKNGSPCLSDFGLALLLNPADATARLGGYRAPEQTETRTLSQEADVYGFGVVLLEVLTGRVPSQCGGDDGGGTVGIDLPEWVRSVVREEWTAEVFDAELMRYKNIEEDMVAMLQVAMACVGPRPEERPRMCEVVKMIEDIRGDLSSLVDEEELDDSLASSSPSIVTTDCDVNRPSY